MTFELTMLVAAAVLTFFMVGFQGLLTPLNQGFGWGLGSRDEPRDVSALQGRAARTVSNQLEAMTVFVPLVVAAHLAGISTPLTVWGAGLFVAARAIYWPIYWAGIPVVRTIAWAAGGAGLIMIAIDLVGAAL